MRCNAGTRTPIRWRSGTLSRWGRNGQEPVVRPHTLAVRKGVARERVQWLYYPRLFRDLTICTLITFLAICQKVG